MRDYLNLREKVDAEFDRLSNKHQREVSCDVGCHDCCAPSLSVTRVEADQIKAFLHGRPELIERLQSLALENPYKGTRCSLLNADGHCLIYEVRPIVCRSHGVPVLVQIDEKHEGLDACPKNFTHGLDMLDVGDWINVDTLNTMTALIDWRYALDQERQKPDPETDRVLLSVDKLLG